MYSFATAVNPERVLQAPDILVVRYRAHLWLPHWNLSNRLSKYWLLYWNETPGAVLHFADHQVKMTPECLVLIPPYTLVTAETKEPFYHNFAEFSAGKPFDCMAHKELLFTSENAQEVFRNHDNDTQRFSLRLYSLIYQLLLKIPAGDLQLSPRQMLDPRINHALDLIETSHPLEYNSSKLAKLLCLSESRFIHLFKEQTQMSPSRYMLMNRLDIAQRLLADPQRTIPAIAEDTGFVDRSHFERMFTKEFGMTPAAMRRLYKNVPSSAH